MEEDGSSIACYMYTVLHDTVKPRAKHCIIYVLYYMTLYYLTKALFIKYTLLHDTLYTDLLAVVHWFEFTKIVLSRKELCTQSLNIIIYCIFLSLQACIFSRDRSITNRTTAKITHVAKVTS